MTLAALNKHVINCRESDLNTPNHGGGGARVCVEGRGVSHTVDETETTQHTQYN